MFASGKYMSAQNSISFVVLYIVNDLSVPIYCQLFVHLYILSMVCLPPHTVNIFSVPISCWWFVWALPYSHTHIYCWGFVHLHIKITIKLMYKYWSNTFRSSIFWLIKFPVILFLILSSVLLLLALLHFSTNGDSF